ncbi:hypothetical protein ACFWGJ_34610, partial [Streptomyces sp. NPDC060205]
MTYEQQSTAAPPRGQAGASPAIPPQATSPGPQGRAGGPDGGPPRRTAWAEGVDRLRAGATT